MRRRAHPAEPSAPSGLGRRSNCSALADREHNTPGQLSGGQQQRVAIARALINNPILLLADEPTGNLDTRNSHEIMETLQALNRERGVTIIVVTHEPDIATYADRVITMRDGEIISDERKPAVRRPPEVFTAYWPRACLPARDAGACGRDGTPAQAPCRRSR